MMYSRDYRDFVSGLALITIGCGATVYAYSTLRLGTLSQMGPGMFPMAVGVLIAVLGAVVLLSSLAKPGERLDVDLRSLLTISLSVLVFGLAIRPLGLVPAVVGLVLIATRADSKLSWFGALVLATTLSLVATLIFRVGLGMPIATAKWPW